MRSLYNYIIYSENRYNNSTTVEDKELILNTEISERDYMYTNRIGKVISLPIMFDSEIKKEDEVILHHNVFRRWIDIYGKEKNSSSFVNENQFLVAPDQIYAYKRNGNWRCLNAYCFVKPINNESKWSVLKEKQLYGELVYSNNALDSLGVSVGDVVALRLILNMSLILKVKNYIEFYQIKLQ